MTQTRSSLNEVTIVCGLEWVVSQETRQKLGKSMRLARSAAVEAGSGALLPDCYIFAA